MQDLKQQDHLVATLPQSCLGLEDHHEQIPHTPHKEGDVVIVGGEPAGWEKISLNGDFFRRL